MLPEVVPPPADTAGRVVTVRSPAEGTCPTNASALLIRLRTCADPADRRWRPETDPLGWHTAWSTPTTAAA